MSPLVPGDLATRRGIVVIDTDRKPAILVQQVDRLSVGLELVAGGRDLEAIKLIRRAQETRRAANSAGHVKYEAVIFAFNAHRPMTSASHSNQKTDWAVAQVFNTELLQRRARGPLLMAVAFDGPADCR